ncbi:MAG: hypothetical protein Q8N09_03135 [Thermodesulfovibrionia bacterium]|nr:hypothetical protein [Thermodesulfovibrionia bacterium]
MFSKKQTGQVFPLSITEIAFIIIFILILFIGLKDRQIPEITKQREEIARKEQSTAQMLQKIHSVLKESGSTKPDEILSELIRKIDTQAENEHLKQKIENLEAELSILTEIKNMIQKKADKDNILQEEIMTALALKNQLKKITEKEGGDNNNEQNLLEKIKDFDKYNTEKDNELKDIRGQLAFFQKQLEAHGGRDYPPCWVNETTGEIQFFLDIAISDEGLITKKAWSLEREEDALKLPGIDNFIRESPLQSLTEFKEKAFPIYQWSRKRNPECRHYVYIKSTATQAPLERRLRWGVEDFFYKYERRR